MTDASSHLGDAGPRLPGSVTRLRLRRRRYCLPFAWYTARSLVQVRRSPGHRGSRLTRSPDGAYWTMTLWDAVPPLPLRFFRIAWNLLAPAGRLRLLMAEQGPKRTPLAGSLFVMSGPTVFFAFSARHREGMSFRPNEAIHWRAINDACTEGFRSYDLGEVTENNPGLAVFKSKWGAQRRQLHRYYYPAAREVAGGSPGPLRRAADRAWQRLPLPATAVLGDWMSGRL